MREHQDACEFFQNLTDKLDVHLAAAGKDKGFEQLYGGVYADQKIGRSCSCYYETTQPFMNISVDVRNNNNLHESLDAFVAGDELSGDNAYFCEQCNKKVTALKRTCIKTLPTALVIQLKRFDYDWENERQVKFNDRFEFPLTLDMMPWTVTGLAERDAAKSSSGAAADTDAVPSSDGQPSSSSVGSESDRQAGSVQVVGGGTEPSPAAKKLAADTGTFYRLRGVVVHSGSATAG